MKDSTKLFVSAVVLLCAGFMKACAPMILDESFDAPFFLFILSIAIIATIIGFIKRKNGN